jgi:hypothetical protein
MVLLPLGAQDAAKPGPVPKLPYYDWGACPFEGCSYREWTAKGAIPVFDTWEASRRRLTDLAPGQKVDALSGVVITMRAGVIRMDRDLPPSLRKGDTILTYTYKGEGFSSVWFRGAFHSEFDISFAKWPDGSGCGGDHCAATYVDLGDKQWWAQVRLKSETTGWVDMEHSQFDGTDLLASGAGRTGPVGRYATALRSR